MASQSDPYGLIVVGSGPAGVAAAASYREAGGEGAVLLLSADEHPPYERPPLSKEALRGDAPELSPIAQADDLGDVEVRLATSVDEVDLVGRTVRAGGEQLPFAALVLAPGSRPVRLPDVDDDAEVRYLRSYADLERLHEAVRHARTALVIGSGFIGCEAAVSLALRGLEVTVVSAEETPQGDRLGERAGALVQDLLVGHGVTFRGGVQTTGIHAPRTVHLDDGTTLEPDLVLVAVGVEAATSFLEGSGVPLHEGSVVVDDHLRAADGVWAAGDAARAQHGLVARPLAVEHWFDAETMGGIAGANAAGADRVWDGVPGFWSQIGEHWLKWAAWGDGYDELEAVERPGGLTVWYGREGVLAGVLTYEADDDYERGEQLVGAGAPFAAGPRGDQPDAEGADAGTEGADAGDA